MAIKLDVPFVEKDIVKSLGAKWESNKKTWYIPTEIRNIAPFFKWLPHANHYLIPVHSYILEGTSKCWNCKRITKVVTLASATYRTLNDDNQLGYSNKMGVFSYIREIEKGTLAKMKKICPDYEFRFSKTFKGKYWMNKCEHCKSPIGDFFLFDEMDGPFLNPLYSLSKGYIKVYKLNEIFDVPVDGGIGTHFGQGKTVSFLNLIK